MTLGRDLAASRSVLVKVVSPEGTPVVDAEVGASNDVFRASGVTDELGEAMLEGLSGGEKVQVTAVAPRALGFGCAGSVEDVPFVTGKAGGGRLQLTLEVQPVELVQVSGLVVSDGGVPVAGALVRFSIAVETACNTDEPSPASTDADGSFRIDGVRAGFTQDVEVWHRGFPPMLHTTVRLDEGPYQFVLSAR